MKIPPVALFALQWVFLMYTISISMDKIQFRDQTDVPMNEGFDSICPVEEKPFKKFVWLMIDGEATDEGVELRDMFETNNKYTKSWFKIQNEYYKNSPNVYDSFFSGKKPGNVGGTTMTSDHLFKQFHRAGLKPNFHGDDVPSLQLVDKEYFESVVIHEDFPEALESDDALEKLVEYVETTLETGSVYIATNHIDHLNHRLTKTGKETVKAVHEINERFVSKLKAIIEKHDDIILVISSDHGGDAYKGESVTHALHGAAGGGNEAFVLYYAPVLENLKAASIDGDFIHVTDFASTLTQFMYGTNIPAASEGRAHTFTENNKFTAGFYRCNFLQMQRLMEFKKIEVPQEGIDLYNEGIKAFDSGNFKESAEKFDASLEVMKVTLADVRDPYMANMLFYFTLGGLCLWQLLKSLSVSFSSLWRQIKAYPFHFASLAFFFMFVLYCPFWDPITTLLPILFMVFILILVIRPRFAKANLPTTIDASSRREQADAMQYDPWRTLAPHTALVALLTGYRFIYQVGAKFPYTPILTSTIFASIVAGTILVFAWVDMAATRKRKIFTFEDQYRNITTILLAVAIFSYSYVLSSPEPKSKMLSYLIVYGGYVVAITMIFIGLICNWQGALYPILVLTWMLSFGRSDMTSKVYSVFAVIPQYYLLQRLISIDMKKLISLKDNVLHPLRGLLSTRILLCLLFTPLLTVVHMYSLDHQINLNMDVNFPGVYVVEDFINTVTIMMIFRKISAMVLWTAFCIRILLDVSSITKQKGTLKNRRNQSSNGNEERDSLLKMANETTTGGTVENSNPTVSTFWRTGLLIWYGTLVPSCFALGNFHKKLFQRHYHENAFMLASVFCLTAAIFGFSLMCIYGLMLSPAKRWPLLNKMRSFYDKYVF
eukprot:TRINITY_DN4661_c0_g2_i1.p1 TRINITY_DN4661_c0_g2~~TRINITY_DN4661_c0_g2_i1.p1  ORF type:complete len:886 (+),score=164.69 TRINITY_DN4661_c0_g2_i1:93-2750(+)